MALPKIEPFAGTIEHKRGRQLSELTRFLREQLSESAAKNEARIWRGAAKDWKLNKGRLRTQGQKLDMYVSVSIVDDGLAFKATMKSPPEAPPAPEAASPVPSRARRKS